MKRAIIAFSVFATVLILLGLPGEVCAKAPTVKITVSGGGIKGAIEITNPQLLAISEVWMGQFLDPTRIPLSESPAGLKSYEVSFYVKLAENNVRKMYVVYYYPNVRSEQGFIYLPAEGPIRKLNIGTIYREEQEGKWNYASRAWEALIKPMIANAETKSRSGSGPKAGAVQLASSAPPLNPRRGHTAID